MEEATLVMNTVVREGKGLSTPKFFQNIVEHHSITYKTSDRHFEGILRGI